MYLRNVTFVLYIFNRLVFITEVKSVYCAVRNEPLYRVIHKSLQDFRPLRYSSRDGHAEEEHVNRGRDTPSFCPTLQVLDISTLGDAVDVNSVIKFLSHTYNVYGRNVITELNLPCHQGWTYRAPVT